MHYRSILSVTGIVVGIGIGDPSSNPGQVCLSFTLHDYQRKEILIPWETDETICSPAAQVMN